MGGTIHLPLGAGLYMEQRSLSQYKTVAMKWSIKHFQTYLLGCHFKVYMDNKPLMYYLTSPNMDGMKKRWINKVAKYDLSLEYQRDNNNTVADALS